MLVQDELANQICSLQMGVTRSLHESFSSMASAGIAHPPHFY